jgi:sulfocyanin
MSKTFATAFLAFAAILAGHARADENLVPAWMKADESAKSVQLEIVAGWNPNNGALNFNGYYKGDLTIVVPVGWTVVAKFSNHDGMLPHSMLVTRPLEGHIPEQAGLGEVAISRAYSNDPESGIMSNQHDEVRFVARDAGNYWLLCGVTGHGLQGMWVKLDVDAHAALPHIVVVSGAEPGWR